MRVGMRALIFHVRVRTRPVRRKGGRSPRGTSAANFWHENVQPMRRLLQAWCAWFGLFERAGTALQKRLPSFGRVASILSVLALVFLSYTAGAAVMRFGLPSSDYFEQAFAGAEVWYAKVNAPPVLPIA